MYALKPCRSQSPASFRPPIVLGINLFCQHCCNNCSLPVLHLGGDSTVRRFVVVTAQLAGALSANLLFGWLGPNFSAYADHAVVPPFFFLEFVITKFDPNYFHWLAACHTIHIPMEER
jgi:hypothetical protein